MSIIEAKDRFVTPGPLPSPFEAELLEILIEECAESIQRATKMLRFGTKEIQPGQSLDNRTRLSMELGDLFAMVRECELAGLIDSGIMTTQAAAKLFRLAKYMQHMPDDVRARINGEITLVRKP